MTKLDPLTDSRFLNLIIPIVLLAGITLALHFLLGGRGWKDHTKGLWPLVVGKDRRLSTSKVQLVLWTFAIVLALLLLLFYGKNFSAFELEPEYLLLLGSPAAAALLAKTFTTTKISNGTVENTVAEEPSLKDVVSDDEGNTDLFDFQYFLFNLVLLLWFAVEMFRTLHDPSRLADEAYFLPPLPLSLVGLTSASAASYVVKKGLESERPVLQAAYPSAAAPHEEVRLTGRYLRITSAAPEGGQPAQAPTAVTFGGRPASISSPLRANPQGFDEIGVVVPVDIPPGRADAQFTRADGAVSDPLQFEVTSGGPTVFSVSPDRVILKDNAQEVTIAGSGFGDPDPGAPPQTNRVTLGGVPLAVPNGYWNSERIRAQVPALAQARQQGLTVPGKHDLIVIDRYGRRSSPAEVELVEGANSDTSERTEIDLAAEEGQKSDSEVRGHLAEYRRQIEEARGEGRQILEDARKQAEAQRERTKREAREEGDRIIQRAREEIDRERESALREVRREVADMVVQASEQVIGRSIDRDEHERLISQALDDLEAEMAESGTA